MQEKLLVSREAFLRDSVDPGETRWRRLNRLRISDWYSRRIRLRPGHLRGHLVTMVGPLLLQVTTIKVANEILSEKGDGQLATKPTLEDFKLIFGR